MACHTRRVSVSTAGAHLRVTEVLQDLCQGNSRLESCGATLARPGVPLAQAPLAAAVQAVVPLIRKLNEPQCLNTHESGVS